MLPARNNMFLVCVTVGLVFLASKYRNNVLRSVKHLCKNIANRNNRRDKNIDDTVTAKNDNNNNCKDTNNDENCKNDNGIYTNINNNDEEKKLQITLDKIILADSLEKCDYAVQRIRWWVNKEIIRI